ncbi:MAG TPA: VWA domain-containing protein [Patescibacteria group bacterium]|nr:VWA domain-containing protein [Patescibacteria group bacterium]
MTISTRPPIVTLTPARSLLPAGRESTLDLLIRIDAPAPEGPRERRLLNFGIVLDRSGSMSGQKLARAKEAVAFAVRNMAPADRVSLTIYDDKVTTLVGSGPVSLAGPRILELLDSVQHRGSTALHDAWVKGGLEVSEHLDTGRVNRVLLISDGLANVGETNPDLLVSRAGELFARGVSTSTIGVGANFNEDLMIPMAVSGGGSGWFVETPDDFRRIFEAELAGLMSLFGERGVMRIEPRRPGTLVVEVLNDLPAADDGSGGWKIGTLSHGQPLEIVARVKTRGGEVGQPLDLLDVRLSWDVIGQGRFELQQLLRIACDDAAKVELLPVDPEVNRVVALLMAARARKEAIAHADAGDTGHAVELLRQESSIMSSMFVATGLSDYQAEAAELEGLVSQYLAGGPEHDPVKARKQAAYQAYSRASKSQRKS